MVESAYIRPGSGCRLVAVPAFKAVRGAEILSPVGSIPTPSALNRIHRRFPRRSRHSPSGRLTLSLTRRAKNGTLPT